jgi:endonuclease YncB( thermonuclease family)
LLRSLLLVLGLCWLTPPALAQSCSTFRSCEEAMRSLRAGNTRIDGDGDGIPCESLCRGQSKSSGSPMSGGRSSSNPSGAIVITTSAAAAAPRSAAAGPSRSGATQPASAGPVALVSVGDGDTIRVRTASGQVVTVRVACIDAPETAQGDPGAVATQTLRALLAAGSLQLRPQTVDRYGRTVAEVLAGGRNVGLEMVRRGDAFVYYQYLRGCDENAYLAAEAHAQRFRQGVWRWGNVERPWDFRRNRRSGS